jgi:hypothetical protein
MTLFFTPTPAPLYVLVYCGCFVATVINSFNRLRQPGQLASIKLPHIRPCLTEHIKSQYLLASFQLKVTYLLSTQSYSF